MSNFYPSFFFFKKEVSNFYPFFSVSKKRWSNFYLLFLFPDTQFSRNPTAKIALRYDKLMVEKDVYAFNEVIGVVQFRVAEVGALAETTKYP